MNISPFGYKELKQILFRILISYLSRLFMIQENESYCRRGIRCMFNVTVYCKLYYYCYYYYYYYYKLNNYFLFKFDCYAYYCGVGCVLMLDVVSLQCL